MRISPQSACVVAILVGGPVCANESGFQYEPNIYVAPSAGLSVVLNQELVANTPAAAGQFVLEFEFDKGIAINLAVGTKLPYGFRVELEGGLSDVDVGGRVDVSNAVASAVFDTAGEVEAFSLMTNVLYDYAISPDWHLSAGVGAGVVRLFYSLERGAASAPGFLVAKGDDTRFA